MAKGVDIRGTGTFIMDDGGWGKLNVGADPGIDCTGAATEISVEGPPITVEATFR